MEHKKKEFRYRGKTLEELKQLDIREFAKLLTSRERRSVLRNDNIIQKFIQRCKKKEKENKQIKTHLRDIIITPELVGMVIYVYNGKDFIQARISGEMLGQRLGEFSITRKNVKHGSPGIGATRSSASMSVK
ncbi:MAG: 30S ribosomal protein S19 [Nanoarchaeota archaeon]|nr:30S ribosomal protein S19 [Nanoarchaeota archaeon]